MNKKLNKKLKSKKGFNTILNAISLFVFIILVAFFVDLATITWKSIVTTQLTNDLTRTLCVQSGVQTSVPPNFPGGQNNYTTSSQLYNDLKTQLKDKANITDFKVTIKSYDKNGKSNRTTVLNSGTQLNVDYRGRVQVQMETHYTWGFVGNFIPGLKQDKDFNAIRSGVTEFKYNYDEWIGED